LGNCPWCAVIQNGGPFYFVTVQIGGFQFICGAKELEPLWSQVTNVKEVAGEFPSINITPPSPSPLPQPVVAARRRSRVLRFGSISSIAASLVLLVSAVLPVGMPTGESAAKSPAALTSTAEVVREYGGRRQASASTNFPAAAPDPLAATTAGAALVIGASAWGYCRWVDTYGKERSRRRSALKAAEQGLQDVRQQWTALHDEYALRSKGIRSRLEDLRVEYLRLQPSFDAEMKQLEAAKEQAQLREFLDDQYIERARIPKVGDGRKATLRGYGIETALDVIEKQNVEIPGFGPKLRTALLDWAKSIARQFRFDPRKGVPEAERRLRVGDYRRRQALVEAQIRQALGELQQRTDATRRRGDELTSAIRSAQLAVMQARADVSVT
jgi:DNA-binding helix-hairpin-helix protein with protein kinase domain